MTTELDYQKLDLMLAKVKMKLFYQKGSVFLSTLLCNLQVKWDETIPTACTNEKEIRWNPHFFIRIPIEERVFVLAHEIWHCAYHHCGRLGDRKPKTWNIAADHVINLMLIDQGFSIRNLGFPIYHDPQFKGMSVDLVYEMLDKQNPNGSMGSVPEPEGLADDIEEADITDIEAVGNIVQAVAASKMAGERGIIPGELEEFLDKFLNPILPWEVILQQYLSELAHDDYSYRRPSRRYDDPLMPSLYNEGALQEINWYVDVSGSITEQMALRFFSEMVYVKETFNPGKINIIQFDTRITHVLELTDDDDFNEIHIHGRGGTDLSPVYDHIMKTKPNAALIFSDMECPPMRDPQIPVIWAMFGHGSSYSHTPTYGQQFRIIE